VRHGLTGRRSVEESKLARANRLNAELMAQLVVWVLRH
jgi:hypothetical protein